MNEYQKIAEQFKKKIEKDIVQIYNSCSNELVLKILDTNLLDLEDNCIESSTVIGYCMEEFVVRKLLEMNGDFYKRINKSTINISYDLYAQINKTKILVNFKASKKNNNAIAALKQLQKDYVFDKKEKLFLVFKTNYIIEDKKIKIKNNNSFYLEQFNFDNIKTDNRSWSKNNDNLSGRIQYNPDVQGLKNLNEISYKSTILKLTEFINKKKKAQ